VLPVIDAKPISGELFNQASGPTGGGGVPLRSRITGNPDAIGIHTLADPWIFSTGQVFECPTNFRNNPFLQTCRLCDNDVRTQPKGAEQSLMLIIKLSRIRHPSFGQRAALRRQRNAPGPAKAAGHADRHGPLKSYCKGLLLSGESKSIEPMAAQLAPDQVRRMHQSLHHVVAAAP
jgi:hypothetical protein